MIEFGHSVFPELEDAPKGGGVNAYRELKEPATTLLVVSELDSILEAPRYLSLFSIALLRLDGTSPVPQP